MSENLVIRMTQTMNDLKTVIVIVKKSSTDELVTILLFMSSFQREDLRDSRLSTTNSLS